MNTKAKRRLRAWLAAVALLIAIALGLDAYAKHTIRRRIENTDTFVFDYGHNQRAPARFVEYSQSAGGPFHQIKAEMLQALSREDWLACWGGERIGELTCRTEGRITLAAEVWDGGFWSNGRGFATGRLWGLVAPDY